MKKSFISYRYILALCVLLAHPSLAQEYDPIDWNTATIQDIRSTIPTENINKNDTRGLPPLFYACHSGNPEIIEALVKEGADIKFKVNGKYNLLMVASQWNTNPKVIQTLIKYGFDVNEKTKNGDTALLLAAMNNPATEVIQTLIDSGADVNYQDKEEITPLLMASARNPNPEVIEVLVKNGADINAVSHPKGKEKIFFATTLSAALVYNSNPDVAKKILSLNVDLNKQASYDGSTLFMNVCPVITEAQLINDMIQKYGADITVKTKPKGSTPLMVCSMFSQTPEVIQALIDNGAVVNERTSQSWTPLMSAAANPNPEIIKVLLKNGADVQAMEKTGNATPLMFASRINPNKEVILALIDAGADIHKKDKDGKTAYDWAKKNPHLKNDKDLLNRLNPDKK